MDSTRKINPLKWLGITALAGIIIWALLTPDVNHQLQGIMAYIRSLGYWGALLFTLVYVVATVILVPGSILTLGAGAAFGLWKGFILVSFASTLAATAAFLVGRHLAHDWLWRKIGHDPRMTALKGAIDREGWKIVGLARLSPMFPYTMLNYFFSLTSLRFTHYVLASWVGMIPGTFAYVYLGSLGGTNSQGGKSAIEWILLGIGVLATITATLLISRSAARAMVKNLREN